MPILMKGCGEDSACRLAEVSNPEVRSGLELEIGTHGLGEDPPEQRHVCSREEAATGPETKEMIIEFPTCASSRRVT